MSAPNPYPSGSRIQVDAASSSVPTDATVSGIPFIPVYAPPMGHDYGQPQQQQFPPPLIPANYVQYGAQQKPSYPQIPVNPPPPSIYYSRWRSPNFNSPPYYGYPQSHYPAPIGGQVVTRDASYNSGEVYTIVFMEEAARSAFTKHVMMLLMLQFAISTAMSAVCLEHDRLREDVVEKNAWVLWLAMAIVLMVIVFSKLKPRSARKRPADIYLFVTWVVTLGITLAWITSLLDLQFLLVMQLLLTIQVGALILVSALRRTSFLTGKSMLISGFSLLLVAIALAVFYTHDAAVVFFAIFTSMLVLMYFLFRLHYLMGDEYRKLQPHEILTGAMNIFF